MLEVVNPGLLLAIQDGGRPGLARLGVPRSGAADAWGLAVANILAGAPAAAAALEATLGGAELLAVETCAVALGGADLCAERDDGQPLASGRVHRLPAGARIRLTGGPHTAPTETPRVRAYLALAGGIATPRVLGSASTLAIAALGGIDGRTLRPGDRVAPVRPGDLSAVSRTWPFGIAPHPSTQIGPIRFVPGPDLRHLPADAVAALEASTWTVGPSSDRMGIRLDGPPLAAGNEILSHPVVPGAIQLPPDGRPLVLMVDGPTIGGYPVLGVVSRAELPRLGQLRPGDRVTFGPQDAGEARMAWRDRQQLLARVAESLRADAAWDALAGDAGA